MYELINFYASCNVKKSSNYTKVFFKGCFYLQYNLDVLHLKVWSTTDWRYETFWRAGFVGIHRHQTLMRGRLLE